MDMFSVHQVWQKPSCKTKRKGEEDKAYRKEMGRQHQGMDRPGIRQVLEGGGQQKKMEETGCEVTCDAPTTSAVKG